MVLFNSKLIAIFGDRGSGKSLLLTRFALKSNLPFFSNYKIYADNEKTKFHPRYNELHPEEILKFNANPKEILITEAYEYFESRLGMGAFQRYMSYTIFQSRKKNSHFIIDSQLDDSIDHRFTRLCDYIIVAECEHDGFQYYCSNKKFVNSFFIPFKQAEKFWDKYDSWEIVTTSQIEDLGKQIETTNKPKLKARLKELEIKFFEEYGEMDKKRITHAVVENFLLDCEESDVYESFLYARLQKPTR